jgi:hypothetical protein
MIMRRSEEGSTTRGDHGGGAGAARRALIVPPRALGSLGDAERLLSTLDQRCTQVR